MAGIHIFGALLGLVADPDILLNKNRMAERKAMADDTALPEDLMLMVSSTYRDIARTITGSEQSMDQMPRNEINDILSSEFGLL